MRTYNVILSGGIGSRLWPLSRQKAPKQFLKIFSGKSLFQLTAERNAELADGIMVVGNAEHVEWSKEMLSGLNVSQKFVVETQARNTAAAIAFAAMSADPDDVLIVTPSDHLISNASMYAEAVREAENLAIQGYLVTFGIVPTKPETGYGYIESNGRDVISFREKPNEETAKEFITKGNFLWNSGMFCFKAGVLLNELKAYQPDIYEACVATWQKSQNGVLDSELSLKIPSISIDYAVMERSKKIKVVPAKFTWNDLGSFESLYDYLKSSGTPVDENGNMTIGTQTFTAFVGVENCIFVHTPDAFLVLQKEKSQDVKQVYSFVEKNLPELK